MDLKRLIHKDHIPDHGINIGQIGRFTLVYNQNHEFTIHDNLDNQLTCTSIDFHDLHELIELSNEWLEQHQIV